MNVIIKILIALFLIGCLFNVPYGYFQFVRIASCIGFAYLAYKEFEEDKTITGILCIGCAILFNPIFKIYFKRELWNDIDLVIAIALGVWIIADFVYLLHGKSGKKKLFRNYLNL